MTQRQGFAYTLHERRPHLHPETQEAKRGKIAIGTIIAAVIVLALSVGVSVGSFLIVDHAVPIGKREGHNDVAGFVYAVLGPLYAILLAFVVVVVWGYFEDARSAAANEAVSLQVMYGLARGMNSQQGLAIEQASIDYGESVVQDDWPAMAHGAESAKTSQALEALRSTIDAFNPTDARTSNLDSQALVDIHDVATSRELRILKGEDDIHPVLWIGLIVGAVITIAYSYLFGVKNRAAHVLIITALTIAIGGILFMTYEINGPYRGDVRVGPTAMEAAVTGMRSTLNSP